MSTPRLHVLQVPWCGEILLTQRNIDSIGKGGFEMLAGAPWVVLGQRAHTRTRRREVNNGPTQQKLRGVFALC